MGRNNIQILQVAARERNVGNNLNLSSGSMLDLDLVAQVADTALNLDAVVQELLESSNVEDLVVDGLGGVDGVLGSDLLGLTLSSASLFVMRKRKKKKKILVVSLLSPCEHGSW